MTRSVPRLGKALLRARCLFGGAPRALRLRQGRFEGRPARRQAPPERPPPIGLPGLPADGVRIACWRSALFARRAWQADGLSIACAQTAGRLVKRGSFLALTLAQIARLAS